MTMELSGVQCLSPSSGDDSAAIIDQAAWNSGYVRLAEGDYKIETPISTTIPLKLMGPRGMGECVRIHCTAPSTAITINSGSAVSQVSGLRFSDLTLIGHSDTLGFQEHIHLLNLSGVDDVKIDRCGLIGFRGDGIYFGSGSAGQERHNTEIDVTDSCFDGVNNSNRNGISIVDGVGVRIRRNRFANIARNDMPGAIDIEPNSNTWHRVNKIYIIDNDFENITGNCGAVSFILTMITLTKAPGVFLVQGNRFDTPIADAVTVTHSNYSRDIRLSITGNIAEDVRRFLNISGIVRGVAVTNNDASSRWSVNMCGLNASDVILDSVLSGNRLLAPPDAVTGGGGVIFSSARNLSIIGNIFNGQYGSAIRGGFSAGATITNTRIIGNQSYGLRGTGMHIFQHDGGWDSASCEYALNGGTSNLV